MGVPADGNFTTAIARGNHKAGEIQGQTRQHARLINLLGVKQIVIGVNKMDCDTAGYKKDRYDEISAEMASELAQLHEHLDETRMRMAMNLRGMRKQAEELRTENLRLRQRLAAQGLDLPPPISV